MNNCTHNFFLKITQIFSTLIIFTSLLFVGKSALCNGLVDIGGGRKMYMECIGTGSPTVVLIPGYRDRGDSGWATLPLEKKGTPVFPAVGKFTRVCTYDRPGTMIFKGESFEPSRSDSVFQPVTVKSAAMDLHALMTAAKIQGPYVIVGHSMGGLITKLYAALYPKDICGLVFVDSVVETAKDLWTPRQWEAWKYALNFDPPALRDYKDLERFNVDKSFQQIRGVSLTPLSNIPAIILTADHIYDAKLFIKEGLLPHDMTVKSGKQLLQSQINSQDSLPMLFGPTAIHIKNTHSHHYIQKENPQLVIDAIRQSIHNKSCKDLTSRSKNSVQ